MLYNSLSRTAKENMLQPCASMRWHHDEIGGNLLCDPADFIECGCAAENMADSR